MIVPHARHHHVNTLRLLLDTADRAAWDRWLPAGIFHGVTTNPVLLQRAGLPCRHEVIEALVRDALSRGLAEIHVQTWGRESEALLANARRIAALDRRVVVKVPLTFAGVHIVPTLRAEGVRITLTAVYAAHQALTAAAAGADYVAPYFGRIGDAGRDAVAEMRAMRDILVAAGGGTRLLVASLRRATDVATLAAAGLDTFTFGPAVAEELFSDGATATAAEEFERAAEH